MIASDIQGCDPYSGTFMKAGRVRYEQRHKPVVEKTLPLPSQKPRLKIISLDELIDRYIKVETSKRFSGTGEWDDFKAENYKITVAPGLVAAPEDDNAIIAKVIGSCEGNRTATILDLNATTQPAKRVSREERGIYRVREGDALSKIAVMFGLKTEALMKCNTLKKRDHLRIGQKLSIPMNQKKVDAIVSAAYRVEKGDTLTGIAKMFNLDPKAVAKHNGIGSRERIREGKVLKLPLPHLKRGKKEAKKKKRKKKKKNLKRKKRHQTYRLIREYGKRRLRVTATAYSSHGKQTDSTPFLAAWNNRLRPGMKVIAVSRDLLTKYGMRNGTRVRIGGLPGIYRVRDKMNKRYRKRIDIYMGLNRRKALRWGRRSVIIYW